MCADELHEFSGGEGGSDGHGGGGPKYQAGGEFTRALDATVGAFWQRNAERLGGIRRGRFDASSRSFLLEELAVFSFQCAEPAVDAYAGSWLDEIFTALRTEPGAFFDGFRRDWLQVDFTRNKAFVPQIIRVDRWSDRDPSWAETARAGSVEPGRQVGEIERDLKLARDRQRRPLDARAGPGCIIT